MEKIICACVDCGILNKQEAFMNYISHLYNICMDAKNNPEKFINNILKETDFNPLDKFGILQVLDNNKKVIENLSFEDLTKTSDVLNVAFDVSNYINDIIKNSLYHNINIIKKKKDSMQNKIEEDLVNIPTDVLKRIIKEREKNNK